MKKPTVLQIVSILSDLESNVSLRKIFKKYPVLTADDLKEIVECSLIGARRYYKSLTKASREMKKYKGIDHP